MKLVCVFGLASLAAICFLGGCQSGTTEMAGFHDNEGVWFNARGERVHRDQLFRSGSSTSLVAADVQAIPAAKHCAGAGCCKERPLGSRSAVPRSSGYTR